MDSTYPRRLWPVLLALVAVEFAAAVAVSWIWLTIVRQCTKASLEVAALATVVFFIAVHLVFRSKRIRLICS